MSVKQTNELWMRDCEPKRKHLLHAICDCADDEGRAFPSVNYLVWKTDLPRSTVIQYMRELRESGVLEDAGRRSTVEMGISAHTEKDTSVVWVRLEKLPRKSQWRTKGEKTSTVAGLVGGGGVVQQPDGGSPVASQLSPVAGRAIRKNHHEPSVEPSGANAQMSFSDKIQNRLELERRDRFRAAALKGQRDFSKYPLEDWERCEPYAQRTA